MKGLPFAAGLAKAMARRVVRLNDYDRQLHIIYLANDILFKRCGNHAHAYRP